MLCLLNVIGHHAHRSYSNHYLTTLQESPLASILNPQHDIYPNYPTK